MNKLRRGDYGNDPMKQPKLPKEGFKPKDPNKAKGQVERKNQNQNY